MLHVIIGCGIAKAPTARPALELYTGSLYRATRAYAATLVDESGRHGPRWILSARHHLVEPATVLEPYEADLGRVEDRRRWTLVVAIGLQDHTAPGDRIVVLAGSAYCGWVDAMRRHGREVEEPLRGMTIGQRMAWLARKVGSA